MKLSRALGLGGKDVVAFVGGGGKTTAMFRLAEELTAQGKRVVTTTTTRIFAAQILLAPKHIFVESAAQALRDARAAIRNAPHVLLVGATNEQGKAFGVEPALIDQLITIEEINAVLVEADGSRMRPFKAPAEHEPVIPTTTTLLVPVVGINIIDRPLDAAHVHRAERVAQIANISAGTILQNEHIARVLGDARGGLKDRPAHARVIPLVNQVENAEQLKNARAIAEQLLQNDKIDAVAIGAVKNAASPIAQLVSRVAAIILAAGGSTRMRGAVKQLLPWGDTTFVGNAIRAAKNSRTSEIVVVTGNRAEQVEREALASGADVVFNADWETGRASSIRAGIGALRANSRAAIFINADQPFLNARVLDTIVEKFFETGAPIVVPTYEGKTGSPVLFARELFQELCALQGEQGGHELLEKYRDLLVRVDIAERNAALDLDTPEEYEQAQRMQNEK